MEVKSMPETSAEVIRSLHEWGLGASLPAGKEEATRKERPCGAHRSETLLRQLMNLSTSILVYRPINYFRYHILVVFVCLIFLCN